MKNKMNHRVARLSSLSIATTGALMGIAVDAQAQSGALEDVTVWDASATYRPSSEAWDVSVWGKNLSDELYSTHHIDGSYIGATRIFAPPRTYGVSLNYYWK